jgi:hypothetical protein
VLNHPDRRSGWTIVVAGTLAGAPDLDRLHATVPLTSARLARGQWVTGSPAAPVRVEGDPLGDSEVWRPLDLDSEAPVRVLIGAANRVAVAAHHAAFDGLSVLTLLRLLAGQSPVLTTMSAPKEKTSLPHASGAVARLLRPADRIAPSTRERVVETGAWRAVALQGTGVTGRLAAAVAGAVAAHNSAVAAPWRRIGISVGLGGPPGIGNHATYRRVDLDRGADVTAAVSAAIKSDDAAPSELRWAPLALRLLAPVVARLGDSFLVSNLGRQDLTDLSDVIFFPVARGRSAVALGAVAGENGAGTVSLRARHLDSIDAETLLDVVIEHLTPNMTRP